MNFYLIGMMGSGKSTVGKILAKKMEMPFVDLDLEIEKSAGKSISKIFGENGEESFRKMETDQLKKYSNSIVACGGGIVLKNENRQFINQKGKAILLMTSIKELSQRLLASDARPILANNNNEETLTNIWLERKMDYLNTADLTIETDGKNPNQILKEILTELS